MSDFAFDPPSSEEPKAESTYHIIDRHTGTKVGEAKSLRGALRSVDRRDNAYGAYRYYHKRVDK